MANLPTDRAPRVHFSGIGGMGMVAAARLAVEAGWEVRGSDGPLYPPASEMVAALGVAVSEGYRAANLDWKPDRVVVGNALSRGNPEVEAMLERKLHYVSFAEWLKEHVLRERHPVAVCGTHGKTTTTALLAHILAEEGAGSGYFVGGQPIDFGESSKLGEPGRPFVIEGDEYDSAFFDKRAKFLHYLPQIAIVTSVDFDHGDIYADLAEIERAFARMLRQIPQSGWLVACADHPRAAALANEAPCRVLTYGFAEGADMRIAERVQGDGEQRVALELRGRPFARITTSLPGAYNAQNAAAAAAAAHLLDTSTDVIVSGIAGFRGVRRRMEVFYEARGITFVEDFAHHPDAIGPAIVAAREHWPNRRIVVAFEPRTNTTTTRAFQEDLGDALSFADEVYVGPIHRPERIPDAERLDRAELAHVLTDAGTPAYASESVERMVDDLQGSAQAGDLVLVLSNGAFGGIYEFLRKRF